MIMAISGAKIAFYIGLKNSKSTLANADLSIGNPGVGGTQYLFLLTVKEYNRTYGDRQAILLTDGVFGLNDNDIPVLVVGSEKKAVEYCEKENVDWLVFNANVLDRISGSVFDTNVKIAAWAHNTLSRKRQIIAANKKSIQRVVCVSESQYNNMKDTPCWEKCTYINNVVPIEFCKSATISTHEKPIAVYVGSVMPQKGVHNLLEIWKFVEKEVPTAQLLIFGGANVWNPSIKLGRNGAGDIYYDRVIQRRLDRLKHPENIHFMGAKGWKDIDKMIAEARVGIVNPSHYLRDETFCMSAVEMEVHGIPVVSRQRYDGLNTSIVHGKTGFLEEKDKDIAKHIVKLLTNQEFSTRIGISAKEYAEQFIPDNELNKWKSIVDDRISNVECKKKCAFMSKDARLLRHDFILKIGFLIESGKGAGLVLRKLGRK